MNLIKTATSTNEYEELTRDHPWERGTGNREILSCRNCLLDLELMGDQAARIMPSAATRIGAGIAPSTCPGTPAPNGAGYFLRGQDRPGMVRVEPDVFYQTLWQNGPLG